MKFLVCISNVPDTTTKITFTPDNKEFNKAGVQFVINPWDEYALTRAIELKEAAGSGTVTVGLQQALADYQAGDLVTWMLPRALPHIGVVTGQRTADGARPLIVHNIGRGPELEDMLFRFEITGHYRSLAD